MPNSDSLASDKTIGASLLFIAFVVGIAGLYVIRDIVTPFDLAVFTWLIIDAFARWMDRLSPKFPYWLALTIAVLTVVAAFVGIGFIVALSFTLSMNLSLKVFIFCWLTTYRSFNYILFLCIGIVDGYRFLASE